MIDHYNRAPDQTKVPVMEKRKSTTSAIILNIQKMSTEDGPGLRTTIFFKGCSLACQWCHNPEAISSEPQLVWYDWKCSDFGECLRACSQNAISHGSGSLRIDAGRCTSCGDCVRECPTGALEVLGTRWELNDLVREILKDRSYFESAGGGITLSGGEPGLQPIFSAALMERCRAARIHTALDTCGMCSPGILGILAQKADLVLYDLKEIDAERHKRFTGHSNVTILENLLDIGHIMRDGYGPRALWIRTPLVPGATATEPTIRDIGAFIAENLSDCVSRWELCAFNKFARQNYRRLGLTWQFAHTELLTSFELRHFEHVARASGFDSSRILVTGPRAIERPQSVGTRSGDEGNLGLPTA